MMKIKNKEYKTIRDGDMCTIMVDGKADFSVKSPKGIKETEIYNRKLEPACYVVTATTVFNQKIYRWYTSNDCGTCRSPNTFLSLVDATDSYKKSIIEKVC